MDNKNTTYWQQAMTGYTVLPPQRPLAYDKFVNMLKAHGINVAKTA